MNCYSPLLHNVLYASFCTALPLFEFAMTPLSSENAEVRDWTSSCILCFRGHRRRWQRDGEVGVPLPGPPGKEGEEQDRGSKVSTFYLTFLKK